MTSVSQGPEGNGRETPIRRLDHVAIAVRDTEAALRTFRDRMGLEVAHSEELPRPHVRLTYLDAGNAYIQLLEPLDPDGEIMHWIDEHGEGLHHVCFSVDAVADAVMALSRDSDGEILLGSGRNRVSAFLPGMLEHGVMIECTEFRYEDDVEGSSGWLPGRTASRARGIGS